MLKYEVVADDNNPREEVSTVKIKIDQDNNLIFYHDGQIILDCEADFIRRKDFDQIIQDVLETILPIYDGDDEATCSVFYGTGLAPRSREGRLLLTVYVLVDSPEDGRYIYRDSGDYLYDFLYEKQYTSVPLGSIKYPYI